MSTQRFDAVLELGGAGEVARIVVPFDVKEVFGTGARVPVRGTLDGHPFRSSISPMGGGCHILPVNRTLLRETGLEAGRTVAVVMERDEEPRTVTPPDELLAAIAAAPGAAEAWERLAFTRRKEHVLAVEGARKPETRARRIEKVIAELTGGSGAG